MHFMTPMFNDSCVCEWLLRLRVTLAFAFLHNVMRFALRFLRRVVRFCVRAWLMRACVSACVRFFPEITWGNTHRYEVVKSHLAACGVVKTNANNHPSHVAYDTKTQANDTGTVDLEHSYWNSMEAILPRTLGFTLLVLILYFQW